MHPYVILVLWRQSLRHHNGIALARFLWLSYHVTIQIWLHVIGLGIPNAIVDDNPVSYFNSSCKINHPTSLSVHICSYVMILLAKYNILTPLQE